MHPVFEKIAEIGVIPILKIKESANAEDLAKALISGGIPAVEISMRSEAAEESIRIIRSKYPDFLIGAGTVLTLETGKAAIAAGADYIVAPGFNPRVVDYCISNEIPIIPGVNNAAQIDQALERGLDVLKFFPAENSGGIKMLRALGAPYSQVLFIPTGGISIENMGSYLSYERVLACAGSFMLKPELIESRDFKTIEEKVREAMASALGLEMASVILHSSDEEETKWGQFIIHGAMGFDLSTAGLNGQTLLDVSQSTLPTRGEITLRCNRPRIASAYFRRNGIEIDQESVDRQNHRILQFKLRKTVAGFTIRIISRFLPESINE